MKKNFSSVIIALIFLGVSAAAQNLKIDDLTIKVNGQTEFILLKKDGKVTANGSSVGVLSADGKFKDLNGKTTAEIDRQGKITDGNRKMLAVVNKNGDVETDSGKKFVWTKDGKFNVSEKDFLIIAPNKKKFYRTVAFLIFLYLSAETANAGTPVETKTP